MRGLILAVILVAVLYGHSNADNILHSRLEIFPKMVYCSCGNKTTWFKVIVEKVWNQMTGQLDFFNNYTQAEFCKRQNCTTIEGKAVNHGTKKKLREIFGGTIKKKQLGNDHKHSGYPQFFTILPQRINQEIAKFPDDSKVRIKRTSTLIDACGLPKVDNSKIECELWPDWINCKQSCIYGYGIVQRGGTVTSTRFSCRISKKMWNPSPVEDCKPYINCEIRLLKNKGQTRPGALHCIPQTWGPTQCFTKCDAHGNNPATPWTQVSCEKEMELPHCITRMRVELIEPPSGGSDVRMRSYDDDDNIDHVDDISRPKTY